MPSDREREEWLADVESRQRNYVFPNTLKNEVEGYRRLYSSKYPLTVTQLIGFLLLFAALLVGSAGIVFMVTERWKELQGPWWGKTLGMLGPYVVVLSGFALLVYLIGRSAKRAIKKAHTNKTSRN